MASSTSTGLSIQKAEAKIAALVIKGTITDWKGCLVHSLSSTAHKGASVATAHSQTCHHCWHNCLTWDTGWFGHWAADAHVHQQHRPKGLPEPGLNSRLRLENSYKLLTENGVMPEGCLVGCKSSLVDCTIPPWLHFTVFMWPLVEEEQVTNKGIKIWAWWQGAQFMLLS